MCVHIPKNYWENRIMEKFKVEYDSLHKFRVSLGLLIWALPWIVRGLLVTMVSDNISQKDFDELSDFSKDNLMSIWNMRKVYEKYFILIAIAAFLIGLFFLILGLVKWRIMQKLSEDNQKKNNEKLELENKELIARLRSITRNLREDENYNSLLTEEKSEKSKEIEVGAVIPKSKGKSRPVKEEQSITIDQVIDYLAIEDKVYKQLRCENRNQYDFIQNMRLSGNYEIDIVAQSRNGEKDIVYEVKKFTQRYNNFDQIEHVVKKLNSARMAYEAEKGRKAVPILVLVASPKDDIGKTEDLLKYSPLVSNVRIMTVGE